MFVCNERIGCVAFTSLVLSVHGRLLVNWYLMTRLFQAVTLFGNFQMSLKLLCKAASKLNNVVSLTQFGVALCVLKAAPNVSVHLNF